MERMKLQIEVDAMRSKVEAERVAVHAVVCMPRACYAQVYA